MSEITIFQSTEMIEAGQIANQIAGARAFEEYQARRSSNTTRRQKNDLALFAEFLQSAGLNPGDFQNDPEAWTGITWGLVEGFRRWLQARGYAVSSVNVRLSTVKTYAGKAAQTGHLERSEFAMIQQVKGYRRSESKRIDETRPKTRASSKKADPVSISPTQVKTLKNQPNTPQGRRDRLLICLMADHGLRVGEVSGLLVSDFFLESGELRFYRPKVDKTQTHRLSPDTLKATKDYFSTDAPAIGNVFRSSRKSGRLTDQGMTTRAITARVGRLARKIGVIGLSAHDLRHFWATQAARSGTPLDRLQDAGGWSSPAMPLRYIEAAKIANEGVRLE